MNTKTILQSLLIVMLWSSNAFCADDPTLAQEATSAAHYVKGSLRNRAIVDQSSAEVRRATKLMLTAEKAGTIKWEKRTPL